MTKINAAVFFSCYLLHFRWFSMQSRTSSRNLTWWRSGSYNFAKKLGPYRWQPLLRERWCWGDGSRGTNPAFVPTASLQKRNTVTGTPGSDTAWGQAASDHLTQLLLFFSLNTSDSAPSHSHASDLTARCRSRNERSKRCDKPACCDFPFTFKLSSSIYQGKLAIRSSPYNRQLQGQVRPTHTQLA